MNHKLEPSLIAERLKGFDAKAVVTVLPSLAPNLWAKVGPLRSTGSGLRPSPITGEKTLKAYAKANVTERVAAAVWVDRLLATRPVTAVGKIFKSAPRKRALLESAPMDARIRVEDGATQGVDAHATFGTEAQRQQAEERAGTLTAKVRYGLSRQRAVRRSTP